MPAFCLGSHISYYKDLMMLCKFPVPNKHSREIAVPCGQCLPCRINQRRIKSNRLVLEAKYHEYNSFLTLTYSDDNLPSSFVHKDTGEVFAGFSVVPDHHRLFLYNLRDRYRRHTGRSLRFYMVGEYGDKTGRPHYHYALFGYPTCLDLARRKRMPFFEPCQCVWCRMAFLAWQKKGHIFLGDLTLDSAQYVAGYVTKKLTNNSDYRQPGYTGPTNYDKLAGRYPEFSLMSNKPGIARDAVTDIVKKLQLYDVTDYEELPRTLMHGNRSLPMGRYLFDKICEEVGIDFAPKEKIKIFERALRSMFAVTSAHPSRDHFVKGSVAVALELLNAQRVINIESKFNLFSARKSL